jgi:hypothetical protein
MKRMRISGQRRNRKLALEATRGYNDCVPDGPRTPCEGKGATAMSDILNDDKPGFIAEKPEHSFACYRLIQSG